MSDPEIIAVAGDTGGKDVWLGRVAEHIEHHPGRGGHEPVVLQLGDFSFTSGYVRWIARGMHRVGATLLVVPGNHEDWSWIGRLEPDDDGTLTDPALDPRFRRHLRVLPRGYRWDWHGRTWLAVGGAASVDRAKRTDWSSEEEITDADEARAIAGGPADVLVGHDVAAGVPLHLFPPSPAWGWAPRDLVRAAEHRERLARIARAVQPSYMMHGHYDTARLADVNLGWGPVEVAGLATAPARLSWLFLNVRTMEWEIPS
jgi:hypothetical protein